MKHLIKKIGVILLIAFLFGTVACDGTIDGEIVDAPSGKRNVDVSGKTFVLSEDKLYSKITLTTSTFSDGITNSESELLMTLKNERTTYTFSKDGTYTVKTEILYSDEFDGELTYKQTGKVVNTSGDEIYGRAYFNVFSFNTRDYDTIYLNYLDVSYYDNGTKIDYEKFTDTRSFSGYAGKPYKVTEITGTWSTFEEPTDGFNAVTQRYLLTPEKTTVEYFESYKKLSPFTLEEVDNSISADATTDEKNYTIRRLKSSYDPTPTYSEMTNLENEPYEAEIFEATKDGETIYVINGNYYTIKK
ncbi:MAG: hypothetical protein PF637_13590 [Spirochaetes bacterium]|jgi:hypothetical protein|nr:hypothetical protein [Spirochaetota bacterium]